MYRVIKPFSDSQDNLHVYFVGDEYPRTGLEVSNERILGLLGTNNKQGVPLIEGKPPKEIEEESEKKPEKKTRKKSK